MHSSVCTESEDTVNKFDKEVEMILYDVQERNLQEGEEREVNKEEEERKCVAQSVKLLS